MQSDQPQAKTRQVVRRTEPVGHHIRAWRLQRGLSQMSVAVECGVSTRHLSFIETGRARPSRELILHLARHLRPTNRSLNECLLAAGLAPEWLGSPALETQDVSDSLDELLALHHPCPAFVFNADWVMERLNPGGQWLCRLLMPDFLGGADDLSHGVDMLASLTHHGGLLSRMHEPDSTAATLLEQLRLEQQTNPAISTRVAALEESLAERYGASRNVAATRDPAEPYLRLAFETDHGRLEFLTAQSVVGIPQDINVGSYRTELWYPANVMTRTVIDEHVPAIALT